MPGDIVPQVDVGSLTLRGLTAFTPLLAALTTDNVAPLAMIQLENLGAIFHINGQYALRVPDLLRRHSSMRLDQLGMIIGWRKGDAASLMAQSAGGQAVAMMCFCLRNTCKSEDIGSVLYDLSEKALPKSLSISSIGQLTSAANLLASKLQVLGFGNILANQVVRIHNAYDHIGRALPRDFFEFMTRESTVDLYHSLSRVFCDEDSLIRVTGIQAMGHIMAIVLIMFPDNVMLIVEGLLLQEGARTSIILEIDSSKGTASPTVIQVEERLCKSPLSPLPIEVIPRIPCQRDVQYTFEWPGHITDALQIAFADVGIKCSADLIDACCDLLILAAPLVKPSTLGRDDDPLPSGGLMDLLGSEPMRHMYHVCNVVFRTIPPGRSKDIRSAYSNLVDAFKATISTKILCTCAATTTCDISKGWMTVQKGSTAKSVKNCLFRALWRNVGSALAHGFLCLLVDAERNATVAYDINSLLEWTEIGISEINKVVTEKPGISFLSCNDIHRKLMGMGVCRGVANNELAFSNGSSTIFPASLLQLQADIDRGHRYNLCDGQLLIKGRYYASLRSVPAKRRSIAQKSLFNYKDRIRPSSSGEHSRISFTVRESLEFLEFRTTVLCQGHSLHLDLARIIHSSMGLSDAHACEHDWSADLDATLCDDVLTTSIAMPQARGSKVAIVQTKDNATAQLLACENGKISILQRKCCLNCAVLQAKAEGVKQIIVAL
jgi:hypothetical protein